MTFKSLINFGGSDHVSKMGPHYMGPGDYYDSGHRRGYKGGGKGGGHGSGAALSALTLLAFMFLLNIMQQSLANNNATTTPMTTAVLLREEEPLRGREGSEATKQSQEAYLVPIKTTLKNPGRREKNENADKGG